MSWWKPSRPDPEPQREGSTLVLELPGWDEAASADRSRIWRNPDGDVLSFTPGFCPGVADDLDDLAALRTWCRLMAEEREAGLIEVRVDESELGGTVAFVYKQLRMPAYLFTGMLFVPAEEVRGTWTVVSGERGTTGVREAVVAGRLFQSGALTVEGYRTSWAQDPYDPAYAGVHRSALRFQSDDEQYDAQFPDHPLTKVRKVLAALPKAVWLVDP